METVVQRVRGVMNLLLIWALVLFWVATIESVDIYKICHDLEIDWMKLYSAARNGGVEAELSLAKPKGPPLSAEQSALLTRLDHEKTRLSNIRYSSLRESQDKVPSATAGDYLASCERALEIVREGVAAKHPGLSSEHTHVLIYALKRNYAELKWQVERLELGPNATLADVAREARPRITIPGTGQSIPMAGGVALSILGLSCVYLYLVSMLRTLRETIAEHEGKVAREWVFLHPGWLGPMLGLVWLTLPMAALFLAGKTVFSHQAVDSIGGLPVQITFALPIAWLWCMVGALRTRLTANRTASEEPIPTTTAELRLATLADAGNTLSRRRAA